MSEVLLEGDGPQKEPLQPSPIPSDLCQSSGSNGGLVTPRLGPRASLLPNLSTPFGPSAQLPSSLARDHPHKVHILVGSRKPHPLSS